jgi:hypothetical protein
LTVIGGEPCELVESFDELKEGMIVWAKHIKGEFMADRFPVGFEPLWAVEGKHGEATRIRDAIAKAAKVTT